MTMLLLLHQIASQKYDVLNAPILLQLHNKYHRGYRSDLYFYHERNACKKSMSGRISDHHWLTWLKQGLIDPHLRHHCPCLPTILTGHIVPGITIASLIGIRILCKAGCKVISNNVKCKVLYKDNIILCGYEAPTTYVWTLLLTTKEIVETTMDKVSISPNSAHMMLSHHVEHSKAPIYLVMVPEQPSTCVML